MTILAPTAPLTYRSWFTASLLFASTLPAILSVLNFEIFSQSMRPFVFLFSLLVILGGAHVWLTLAYFVDPRWLAHFRTQPKIFLLAPLLIIMASVALVAQPSKPIALFAVYGATLVNIWHHAKQNWGILALVAKARGVNVAVFRRPLVNAWYFFLGAWALQLPELKDMIGPSNLWALAIAGLVAYGLYCVWCIRGRFSAFINDPLVVSFAVALIFYFSPLILLSGKPYSLLIWAGAHALQYYIMTFASLSLNGRASAQMSRTFICSALVLAILAGLTFASYSANVLTTSGNPWDSVITRTIIGFVTGVNLVHFWIDAFIWKFSERPIRELHGEAFVF